MGNGRISLGQEFEVSSVDYQLSTDVFINVIQRRENILYRGSGFRSAANVAYISSQEVTSEANLSIADRSTSLTANRASAIGVTTISNLSSFTINTAEFLVTDIYTDTLNSLAQTPLFFKHTLDTSKVSRVSSDDDTLASGVTLVTVQLLDWTMTVLNIAELKIDYTKGYVYTNLDPYFKSSTDFAAYYVRYTIEDNGETYSYTDLLNNEGVYAEAGFDDLTSEVEIIPGKKVYLLTEAGNEYEVRLPEIGNYSYKSTQDARIQILAPAIAEDDDAWYVRISNGNFLANVNGVVYRYHLAEFLTQSFDPTAPYKRSIIERSTILGANLIKLDRHNVFEDSSTLGIFISILIEDKNGDGIAAFTTDPSLEGTTSTNGEAYVVWNDIDQLGIRSIDYRTGFVDLDGISLKDTWSVISTYTFKETSYEFTLIDFNPITHPERLRGRVAFFLDTDSVESFKSQTLYYMIIDESGRVTASNWWNFNNTLERHLLTGNEVYYDSKPSWKPTAAHHIFLDEFTVEGSGTFLALGEVSVAPGQDLSEVTVLDTRIRGGGIRESALEDALALQPEVDWFWDISRWDGIPYPGSAAYLVEFPVDILDGAGGSFAPSEVRDIIERHTAAGVYPVIRAYGIEVEISGVHMIESGLQVYWNGFGY